MGVEQPKNLIQGTDFINQLILGEVSNGKAGIYIFPVPIQKAEIAAALYGLKYAFEQLSLHHSNAAETENGQLFFWVKQPKACEDSVFNQNILKICHHYRIDSKCAVSVQEHKVKIEIYVNDAPLKTTVELKDAAEWLMSSFWSRFKNESPEIFVVAQTDEYAAVAEPQTNMGRMARQLKADQLVKKLDLTKSILHNKAT